MPSAADFQAIQSIFSSALLTTADEEIGFMKPYSEKWITKLKSMFICETPGKSQQIETSRKSYLPAASVRARISPEVNYVVP